MDLTPSRGNSKEALIKIKLFFPIEIAVSRDCYQIFPELATEAVVIWDERQVLSPDWVVEGIPLRIW